MAFEKDYFMFCFTNKYFAFMFRCFVQGCQMVCFQTKNPDLGKFWRALEWMEMAGIFYGHLVYFTSNWYILRPIGIFYVQLVYFMDILFILWYIFHHFGMLYREKSGNPGRNMHTTISPKLHDVLVSCFCIYNSIL
jgi:hypothetical protein